MNNFCNNLNIELTSLSIGGFAGSGRRIRFYFRRDACRDVYLGDGIQEKSGAEFDLRACFSWMEGNE